MEHQFRLKRLVILVALVVIMGGAAYGYMRWKKTTTSPAYFGRRAEAAYREKNWPVAAHYIQELLKVDKQNHKARILLANIYRKVAHGKIPEGTDEETLMDPPNAIPLLERAASRQKANTALLERVLRAHIYYKNDKRAKVYANALMSERTNSQEAINYLIDDLMESKYWEDADKLLSDIAWNTGEDSPIYLRAAIRILFAQKKLTQLDKLLEKSLRSQATKPAQQLNQFSEEELALYDNVLLSTLRITRSAQTAEVRLLQALDVLEKMLLVTEDAATKSQLVEVALDLVAEFNELYPPPQKRLRFAQRAGQELPIHDKAATRVLEIAAPLVESGEANAKVYEHVARAAMWVDDDSRSIVLLREGLRVYEELPIDLRNELLDLHRDAALEMIARHDLGDGRVGPLMNNKETESIGQLLGGAIALDRSEYKTAKRYITKAREDKQLAIAADALLLRVLMASRDWAGSLELVTNMENGWTELPAGKREWLTKTQGGRESMALIRAYCHFKLGQSADLIKISNQLDGTQFQSKARLLRIADLMRAGNISDASELVRESRSTESSNFDLVMANIGVLLAQGHVPQAMQLMSSYISAYPEDVRGQVVFAQWLSLKGQTEQAEALLAQTRAQFPDEPAAQLLTAELLFKGQNNAELNKLLRTIRQPATANMVLLIATMFELRRQGFDEAADALLAGAPGMPSNSNQILANATTAFGSGEFRAGFDYLAETINIRPGQNPPRSVFLQELNKALETDSEDRDVAISALVKQYPNDPSILLIATEIAFRQGNLRDALFHIENLQLVDKVAGRAEYTRARILKLAGRTKAALASVEDLFEEVPEHQAGRLMAAELEFSLKEYQSCLDHLDHVSVEAKQTSAMLYLRAEALTELGRTQEAEPLLAAYVAREPDKDQARVNLALLMKEHGRREEAIQFLGQALLRMPKSRTMQTAYLDLLAESGRIPELERATRQFTNNRPDGKMALRLAQTFVTAGLFDKAKYWLGQAKSILRGDARSEVTYLEGLIAYEKGKRSGYHNFFVQAKTKFAAVLKSDPQHIPSLRRGLELALFRFNELSLAVDYAVNLEKAVLTRLLTEQDVDTIAEAYRQTGRLDQALDVVVQTLKRFPNSGTLRFQYGAVLIEKAEDAEGETLAKQQLQAAVQLGVPNHHLGELNTMLESFNKPKPVTNESGEPAETEKGTASVD